MPGSVESSHCAAGFKVSISQARHLEQFVDKCNQELPTFSERGYFIQPKSF